MWKKCELEVGVRCSSSGRVSSLPSVNLDIRRGRVWMRRRGGEDAREGVWFAMAMFGVLVCWGETSVKFVERGSELCLQFKDTLIC